jgi:hypothetical protein
MTFSVSQIAHADLVATDWSQSGDSKATLDTDTGLEWLDLSSTAGLSYNQVMSDINFDGWRIPTFDEVITLAIGAFSNYFALPVTSIQNGAYYTQNKSNSSGTYQFISLLGTTIGNGNSGYYIDQNNGNGYTLGVGRGSSSTRLTINTLRLVDYDYRSGSVGMFLVSDGGTTLSSQLDPSLIEH